MGLLESRSREFAVVGVIATLLWLAFAGTPSIAQSPPLLQITSPTDGTVVHPGDTVTVVVTPAKGVTFAMVALFGENSLTKGQVLASPPYQFSLTIPKNISTARTYQISADGAISPGQRGASPPISLDVEPGAPCAKVTVRPNHTDLDAVDLPYRLQVSCTFADGTSMYITDSTQIRYTSFNTSVATVDQNGQVRSVGPGRTTVMANFNGQMGGTLIDVSKPASAAPQAVATGGPKAQSISSAQTEAGRTQNTPQDLSGKDRALSQMRRIVEAIKQCPEKPLRNLDPAGAVQKFSRPFVLDWDVASKPDSLRSPFQGFIRFRIVAHFEESEAAKQSKQLDAQYQKFTLAKKWCDEEHHASCDVTEYRYDFDLGTDAPELRKASMSIAISKEAIVYEPKDGSCWDKIAKSPESVLAGSHEPK